MKRWIICGLAALGLAGCQTARTPSDPFLRRTVPPPATGACITPGTYYNPNDLAPMGAGVTSPPVTTLPPGGAPPTYSSPPGGAPMYGSPPPSYGSQPAGGAPPATYAPSNSAPPAGSLPATPSSSGPSYAPPNGYNWPQSSTPPPTSQPKVVQASAATPVSISPPQSVTSGDSTASDGSSTGFVPKWNSAPRATRASFNQPAPSGSPSPNSGASASTANPPPSDPTGSVSSQSLEITDLPEATDANTLRAYGAPRSRLVIKPAASSDAAGSGA